MSEKFDELGTPGIGETVSGMITKAYTTELRWPSAYPIYSRLRRAMPEMNMARVAFSTFARQVKLEFVPQEDANDAERRFADFGNQVLEDVAGGPGQLIETIAGNTPFWGWSWWEVLPGMRKAGWSAPEDDGWRSEYDDGLIGIRRFAWRDPSTFWHWELSKNGRLLGMWQLDPGYSYVMLPLERSLHLTFGDSNSPEGLTPLEAVYRVERIKYALEVILGIGFEHAAGYLEVRSSGTLDPADEALIRRMARAILTAQEANYAAWPTKLTGEIKDIAFYAGASLLEVIKHYSMVALQCYMMQWVAMATTSGAGAYSALSEGSGMFLAFFNAMFEGFGDQIDAQIGRRLYEWNAASFSGVARRPRIRATKIEKAPSMNDLSNLIKLMVDELGPEDWTAIRKASNVLSTKLKENQDGWKEYEDSHKKAQPPAPAQGQDPNQPDNQAQDQTQDGPVQTAMRRWRDWAKDNDPDTYALISGVAL